MVSITRASEAGCLASSLSLAARLAAFFPLLQVASEKACFQGASALPGPWVATDEKSRGRQQASKGSFEQDSAVLSGPLCQLPLFTATCTAGLAVYPISALIKWALGFSLSYSNS